jgi:hypothetical protein
MGKENASFVEAGSGQAFVSNANHVEQALWRLYDKCCDRARVAKRAVGGGRQSLDYLVPGIKLNIDAVAPHFLPSTSYCRSLPDRCKS